MSTTNKNEIIDITLDVAKKQRFRINEDPKAIIELDLSDTSVLARLSEAYDNLTEIINKYQNLDIPEDDDIKAEKEYARMIKEMDADIRNWIDYVFDSAVANVCCPSGLMTDPIGGKFRFEHIIDVLTGLYSDNLNAEFKKMKSRVSKHTEKYAEKKRKR